MKQRMQTKNRLLSLLLAAALVIVPMLTGLRALAEEAPAGYFTLSVEKFTLGQGYLKEPAEIPFYQGETVGRALARVLGTGNFKNSGVVGSENDTITYLSAIKDEDDREPNPPAYIKDLAGELGSRQAEGWLGEKDYASFSGWMYSVDNVSPAVGMGGYALKSGAVVRIQFTLAMGDLNGPADAKNVDRGQLAKRIAFVNSADNKDALLSDAAVKAAYDNANAVMTDLTKDQQQVDDAAAKLKAALPKTDSHTLTYDLNGGAGELPVDANVYQKGEYATLASDKGMYCLEDKFFANWNTRPDGTGAAYQPGDSLRFEDEDVTLYAIWDDEYAITYDANVENGGGDSKAPTDTNVYFPGKTVTVKRISSSKPETGKVFKEWNVKPDGTGEGYQPNSSITMKSGGITLYAIWEDGFKVTYDANGGTGTVPSDTVWYLEGAQATVKSTTLIQGDQVFKEWNTKADGTGESIAPSSKLAVPKGGVTLYAQYGAAAKVTYDANGGTGTVPTDTKAYLVGGTFSVKSGSSLKLGTDKMFKEWNLKPDGTGDSYKAYDSVQMLENGVTLYAIYVTGYRVSYDLNGGQGTRPEDKNLYLSGGTAYLKSGTSLTKGEDQLFKEWNTKPDGTGDGYLSSKSMTVPEGGVTLYAIYDQGYTLTYDANGGTGSVPVDEKYHLAGEYLYLTYTASKLPAAPEGKVFLGWSLDPAGESGVDVKLKEFPAKNTTVYAIWGDGIKLSYEIGAGTGETPTVDKLMGGYKDTFHYTDRGSKITPPEGLALKEWNTAADGSGIAVTPGQGLDLTLLPGQLKVTLYAIYAPQFQVIYDANGGEGAPEESSAVFPGNTVTLSKETPAKDGAEFRRWNTKPDGTGIEYKPGDKITLGDQDVTLYARWSKNAVRYDANGGENPPVDPELYVPNAPVKAQDVGSMAAAGKRFVCWNTKADGTGVSYLPGDTLRIGKGDLTLYAVWRANEVEKELAEHLAYLYKAVPQPGIGTTKGDWSVTALARGRFDVPRSYYEGYYTRVAVELAEADGVLSASKYTEYARVILGLTAAGYDPSQVAGYNLFDNLADYDKVVEQGVNGLASALLALDSRDDSLNQAGNIRQRYVDGILAAEIQGGGWSLMGDKADPDITAMALQALAPYQEQEAVRAAVERGVNCLSAMQDANGRFIGVDGENAESSAQVVIALSTLGINPKSDERFVKENGNALSALQAYALPGGGFKHLLNGEADDMATDQGILALTAYDRLINGENTLYDMTDAERVENPDKAAAEAILKQAKADASEELSSYKNPADYRAAQQKQLEQELQKGLAAIEQAASVEEVASALAAAKSAMDSIPTDEQLTEQENSSSSKPQPGPDDSSQQTPSENPGESSSGGEQNSDETSSSDPMGETGTSSETSSSGSGQAEGNNSNPVTGAAASAFGMLILSGCAAVVAKKRKTR